MYAPGKLWLKITGIISVIIGFCGVMYGIYWVNNVRVTFADPQGSEVGKFLLPYAIFFLFQGLVTLFAGILAVKNSDDTENYKKCLILGMIVAGCNLIPLFTSKDYVAVLVSMIVPICYLVGVFLNKKGLEDVNKLG